MHTITLTAEQHAFITNLVAEAVEASIKAPIHGDGGELYFDMDVNLGIEVLDLLG